MSAMPLNVAVKTVLRLDILLNLCTLRGDPIGKYTRLM